MSRSGPELLSRVRDKTKRSRKKRCPLCKKLRMKWLRDNYVWTDKDGKETRDRWEHVPTEATFNGKTVPAKTLVCFICIHRLKGVDHDVQQADQ